mmetsp:Transcript_4428/g.16163  ORF Transcript_4428/g.16163 Transcript_4428/m.16163 type:complete len:172 (-) Transcript_4428:3343-3858(-)
MPPMASLFLCFLFLPLCSPFTSVPPIDCKFLRNTRHHSTLYMQKSDCPPVKSSAPKRLPPAGASSFWDHRPSQSLEEEQEQARAGGERVRTAEVFVLGASRAHTSTVIWLHGKEGDDPRGWLRAFSKMELSWCKFLFPVGTFPLQQGQDVRAGAACWAREGEGEEEQVEVP